MMDAPVRRAVARTLLVLAAGAAPVALAAAPVVAGTSVAPEASGAVTVPAPDAGDGASVSVSRTDDLVNQTVEVSWAGFRPSSSNRLQNSGDSLDVNTDFPVRVYQCRGTVRDDIKSSDCYGSPGFRGIPPSDDDPGYPAVPAFTYLGQTDPYAATPDGPANYQDNVTRSDGTGEVTIQLFTLRESAGLGCNDDAPCSVVVVPNYGRSGGQGATEDFMDAQWAWARRTVVPLEFQHVGDACPLTGTSLDVEGSPVAAAVLASWRAKTCVLPQDGGLVRLDYTAIGEPQTRNDVISKFTDVGLTIDPLDREVAATQGIVYSPLAVTGLVVAFQIDDADGKPISDLKLNARLVAKLITASYRSGGDQAVINNPVNIFRDPELKALNPDLAMPSGAPGNHPLLLGDISDTTTALTRWIAADKDAAAFVAGTPDPWGTTVNANYKGLKLPVASFPLLDENLTSTFAPVQGLEAVARQLSIAQFPGGLVTQEGGQTVTTKPPRQNPGRREVIGIIDAAAAARFRLSTAALQNASGAFVKPTTEAMLAGITRAKVAANGVTRSVDLGSKDAAVYPLTLQITGAFPTTADAATRQDMADMLSYVAGDGQQPGDQVGELPPGHASLPPALVAQAKVARAAVLAGYQPTTDPTGDPSGDPSSDPTSDPSSDPSGDPSDDPSGNPSGQATDGTTDSSSGGSTGGSGDPSYDGSTVAALPGGGVPTAGSGGPSVSATVPPTTDVGSDLIAVSGQPADGRSLLLPLLALLGLVAFLVGPVLLWVERSGRGPAWLRR